MAFRSLGGDIVDPRNLPVTFRRIIDAINSLGMGRSNATGTVTLETNATTTEVTDRNAGIDSVITLAPTTANAAAALGTTYTSAYGIGRFTLTHANNAQTDRTFRYAIQG